jgi:4-hydroxybenzoate polyprenyltransferase
MAFTFAINNYYDVKSDKINPRRKDINAIASGKISRKIALLFLLIFAVIPLSISLFYSYEVFFFCIFLLFLGWAYSAPPFRTKNIPVLDIIWHFVGFFSYVIWGGLIAGSSILSGSIHLITWLFAVSIGIFSSIGQIGNHISDYSSDKDSGTKTFVVWMGLQNSRIIIRYLTLIHLIFLIPLILLYSLNYHITIIMIIILPILGLFILKPQKGYFPSKKCFIYFFTVVIGGSIYLSCLIYHFLLMIGVPTLDLLYFINIFN